MKARASGAHGRSPSCGSCPAFDPYLEWGDWKPVYLKQTKPGPNGEEDLIDADGKAILRKGPDGQPVRVGACVLRSPPPQPNGLPAFPQRLSTMRCEDPEKHALLARLKGE